MTEWNDGTNNAERQRREAQVMGVGPHDNQTKLAKGARS